MSKENECPICYEDNLNEAYVLTKCQHKFCPLCYAKHIRQKSNCPLCREEIAPPLNKRLSAEQALQLVHLEILSYPEIFADLEESLGVNNATKTENEKIDDSLIILRKYGMAIAGRCKNWYNNNKIFYDDER